MTVNIKLLNMCLLRKIVCLIIKHFLCRSNFPIYTNRALCCLTLSYGPNPLLDSVRWSNQLLQETSAMDQWNCILCVGSHSNWSDHQTESDDGSEHLRGKNRAFAANLSMRSTTWKSKVEVKEPALKSVLCPFRTELVIYVLERPPQGPAKRIPARELCAFLQQQMQWSQLTSQLSTESIAPKMGWSPEQIKEYMDTPPAGENQFVWGHFILKGACFGCGQYFLPYQVCAQRGIAICCMCPCVYAHLTSSAMTGFSWTSWIWWMPNFAWWYQYFVATSDVCRGNAGWTTSEWTSLPMQELLTRASHRKDQKRVSAELSWHPPNNSIGQRSELKW